MTPREFIQEAEPLIRELKELMEKKYGGGKGRRRSEPNHSGTSGNGTGTPPTSQHSSIGYVQTNPGND